MKKTIIITVAMLCVFGAVVMFGADRVSTDWQQPSEDDVEVSVNSPVLKVENEFKIYNFITPESKDERYKDLWDINYPTYIEPQEDMLTYMQAASYGGAAIEKYFPHLDIGENPLFIELQQFLHSGTYYTIHYRTSDDINNLNIKNRVECGIDAYTGKILSLSLEGRSHNLLLAFVEMELESGKVITADIEKQVINIAEDFAEDMGYKNIVKYHAIKKDDYTYSVFFVMENNAVLAIRLHYDDMNELWVTHFSISENCDDIAERLKQTGKDFKEG